MIYGFCVNSRYYTAIMISRIFPLLFLLNPSTLFSQTEGIVIDKETNSPVPFANIWIANEEIGTTSDKSGVFVFNSDYRSKTLIVSAIGYERLQIQIDSLYTEVALVSRIYQIPEVTVLPKSYDEIVIG